jgi:16S rRNA (cytosine967-C5)-methyltransferase
MSIYLHYLDTATWIIGNYKAELPFHLYLKQYFGGHHKYGSRDRKQIASLCYSFFRFGKSLSAMPDRERMVATCFLLNNQSNRFLEALAPHLHDKLEMSFADKSKVAVDSFSPVDIFPFPELLSEKMSQITYCESMLAQPDVFLRIRPAMESQVNKKLHSLSWQFADEGKNAIRIENGLPVEKQFQLNLEVVVQDLNSQRVGTIVKSVFDAKNFQPKQVWDCCAASGGKSIMLHDIFSGIDITVSDIRQSVLKNLDARFKEAGIRARQQFVADLTIENVKLPVKPTDFIVADVPCTGSGTWARTPEQLYYFSEDIIDTYAEKQKAIAGNAIRYLTNGGWLVYITCSVFKKENEDIVNWLQQQPGIALIHAELLDGTKQKSDSMYVAIFRKHEK